MLVEKLKNHKKHIRTSFREAMEFKAFTQLAYLLSNEFIETQKEDRKFVLGHSKYGSKAGMSDQEFALSELPEHFKMAKEKYLSSLVHQQQVALFENLFFDLLRILLLDRPRRLSNKKKIDYGTILDSETKEDLLMNLVDRELNEVKYKNVSEWFNYLDKLVGLPDISDDQITKLAEAKATRDILVHNGGIVNQIYIRKSGKASRFDDGEKIDVSGDYTREVWTLLISILIDIMDSIITKFEKNST